MRCKPDQLVIVVGGKDTMPPYRGTILKTKEISEVDPECWSFDPPFIDSSDGAEVHVADRLLRPIDDADPDAVDETLHWLPVPEQAVAA